MTVIKQGGVSTKGHQNNLRQYINDDKKVLLRGSQNMEECKDIKRWVSFMEKTRKAYGHDKAARRIRDKRTGELKAGKNTTMYHQILGFNPDECDINGGKLSPEDCMAYAKEYVTKFYPNQQVVFALHNEYCKEDRTHRYAVHMVINRTDLETGKRLDEGLGKTAKAKRASRIREMDKQWDLKQVVKGERNSKVHKKQPSKIEKAIEGRGGEPYKTNLRELCRIAADRAKSIFEFRSLLEEWGVDTQFRNGRMYVTDTDNDRYSFSVARLDADLSERGLDTGFREKYKQTLHDKGVVVIEERQAKAQASNHLNELREDYLKEIRSSYLEYRKEAKELSGVKLSDFPKLKLKTVPAELVHDPEVKRTVLAYWRGADELRVKMASEVPYSRHKTGNGTQQTSGAQGKSIEPAEPETNRSEHR